MLLDTWRGRLLALSVEFGARSRPGSISIWVDLKLGSWMSPARKLWYRRAEPADAWRSEGGEGSQETATQQPETGEEARKEGLGACREASPMPRSA